MPSSRRAIARCGRRATTRRWSRRSCCRWARGSSRRAASRPGMRVLDVAAGTGNASLPAAQPGADVTASDLTPELLDAGRRRADAAGVDARVGRGRRRAPAVRRRVLRRRHVLDRRDVRAPPPGRPPTSSSRVCRPGGTIGLLSWTPGGHDRRALPDDGAVRAAAAARRAAPAAVGQRGAPGRAVRRPRRLRHAAARRPRGHGLRAPARLRRALQGALRPDHRRPGERARATAARRSSRRRSIASATSGTAARPSGRASSWSTCSPSARAPDHGTPLAALVPRKQDRRSDRGAVVQAPGPDRSLAHYWRDGGELRAGRRRCATRR